MKNHKLTKVITNIDRIFALRNERKCIAWSTGHNEYCIKPAAFFVNWSAQMLFIQINYGSLYEVEKINKQK